MLLAHAHRASLVVPVGTHSHMLDFLDRGRPGMASILLIRRRLGGLRLRVVTVVAVFLALWAVLVCVPGGGVGRGIRCRPKNS